MAISYTYDNTTQGAIRQEIASGGAAHVVRHRWNYSRLAGDADQLSAPDKGLIITDCLPATRIIWVVVNTSGASRTFVALTPKVSAITATPDTAKGGDASGILTGTFGLTIADDAESVAVLASGHAENVWLEINPQAGVATTAEIYAYVYGPGR